jgi:zinc protease
MENLLKINYKKFELNNGLKIILYPDKTLPVVSMNIWYKVGSANETKGKTGFAHLFEHMMFQGSKHVPKQMHFKYIQEAGGNLNGSTNTDRTNYYQSVPSNYLELVLWLESDRMGYLLPALTQEKLDNQIDVVKNERRQRYENAPYGLASEIISSTVYPDGHPYHWPTIGWMKDISNINLDDVRTFFNRYYTPNNASLVIGGDFDNDNVLKLIEKYFGIIDPGGTLPDIIVPSFSLDNDISVTHKDKVHLPRIYLTWHTIKAYTGDDAALDIFSYLLTGTKSSKLYKSLVYDKEIAQNVSAYQYSAKYDGTFNIVATAKPGISLEQLKDEIFTQLKNISVNGIEASELEKARNSIKSSFIYSMQNLDNIVNHLNEYEFYLNEPDSFVAELVKFQSIDAAQIKRAATEYLNNHYVELKIIPQS